MNKVSIQLLPSWVEPDPLRGRAIDALGLQATADEIADQILPGISVQTKRARYYSFLCWARQKCGDSVDEERIHRLEIALAVRESHLHASVSEDEDEDEECRFIGSSNLRENNQPKFKQPPKNPRDAYRIPAWRNYRASMRSLGFLDQNNALTGDGKNLAAAFSVVNARIDTSGETMLRESACLSRMSKREANILASALGINKTGKIAVNDNSPPARRLALVRELGQNFTLSDVLARYEGESQKLSPTVLVLREAAIWERLSVGLNAIFLLWLCNIESPNKAVRMINVARRSRGELQTVPAHIGINENAAAQAIKSVRLAIRLKNEFPEEAFPNSELSAFELGEALIKSDSIEDVIEKLRDRHLQAKGDDAWFRQSADDGWELSRDAADKWEPPKAARLHGYRLAAFGSIMSDIRKAQRRRE